MIVIATKTEERLIKDLKNNREDYAGQRCFYLQFSKAEIDKETLQETFLRVLDELPNSYTAQVYICHDQDIFILMKGFMQKQFTDFVQKLSQRLDCAALCDLVQVFEMKIDWQTIEDLCEQKITALNNHKEQQISHERTEAQNKALASALSGLDPNKINDLPSRRNLHADPVIMVVDDDQLSRTLVGNILNPKFNMVFATNGAEAIRSYVENAPDVLFLDIGLPDIGGHELLEAFSQIDPESYIIMFSGRKNKENMLRALRAGAQGFVGKPFTRNEIMHYIEKSPYAKDKHGRAKTSGHIAV